MSLAKKLIMINWSFTVKLISNIWRNILRLDILCADDDGSNRVENVERYGNDAAWLRQQFYIKWTLKSICEFLNFIKYINVKKLEQ